jgi:hypothetical protein
LIAFGSLNEMRERQGEGQSLRLDPLSKGQRSESTCFSLGSVCVSIK